MDAVGSNVRIDTYGWEVKRVLPRLNESINEEWISDKTRYSCDGLLNQRLDVPYIKKDGKLKKTTWEEALNIIANQIKKLKNEEIAGHVGDMANIESIYSLKKSLTIWVVNIWNLEKETDITIPLIEKIIYLIRLF